MHSPISRIIIVAAFVLCLADVNHACARSINGTEPGIPDKIDTPPALPKEFAFTFSTTYGLGDEYPRDPEEFDRMLGLLKGAGYNTVYCPYTEWRVPLFKKHGMKMMVDVLAWKPPVEADVRDPEQRPKVKAMCEALRGNDAIWGYNVWNETLYWCTSLEWMNAWVRMLRTWDPTHPVWVGTHNNSNPQEIKTEPGVRAWYDYHWARGLGANFAMLKYYRGLTSNHLSAMGKWEQIHVRPTPEPADYNRNLWSLNTGIAYGVKTWIWFIGGPYATREPDVSKRWHPDHHLCKLGRHMQPLYKLIGEMGPALQVYSTPTTRNANNSPKKAGIPANTTGFPAHHWLQVTGGEVLCGFFKLADGSDVVYVANHNAFARQEVVMTVAKDAKGARAVWQFDRARSDWVSLGTVGTIRVTLPEADAALFRFEIPKR